MAPTIVPLALFTVPETFSAAPLPSASNVPLLVPPVNVSIALVAEAFKVVELVTPLKVAEPLRVDAPLTDPLSRVAAVA